MHDLEDYSDQRQKAWCVHCGAWISASKTNRDHAPSKSLLRKPLPAHVPQVTVCAACNSGFSLDEQYFVALLSCVASGTTEPEAQVNPAVGRAFVRDPRLKARFDTARRTHTLPDGSEQIRWMPEQGRVDRVVLKNARGHAYYEYGEPMLEDPEYVHTAVLTEIDAAQRATFEDVCRSVWPEVGSRAFTRLIESHDLVHGWVVVQPGIYRYAVVPDGVLTVRSVIGDYLATEVRWDL